MSERRFATASVGTGQERRFAGLAELFEFLVAAAAGGSKGREGNSETSDTTGEGWSTDSPTCASALGE